MAEVVMRSIEDAHGWRRVCVVSGGYGSEQAALDVALAAVPWLAEEGAA